MASYVFPVLHNILRLRRLARKRLVKRLLRSINLIWSHHYVLRLNEFTVPVLTSTVPRTLHAVVPLSVWVRLVVAVYQLIASVNHVVAVDLKQIQKKKSRCLLLGVGTSVAVSA